MEYVVDCEANHESSMNASHGKSILDAWATSCSLSSSLSIPLRLSFPLLHSLFSSFYYNLALAMAPKKPAMAGPNSKAAREADLVMGVCQPFPEPRSTRKFHTN